MEKQVVRLKDQQTTLSAGNQWRLRLSGEALPADRLLALEQLAIRPAPTAPVLFSLDHLQVKSGDRIALVGRNGCGKSSLLHFLWQQYQQVSCQGVVFHPRVRIGYYDQSLQQLNDEDSLSDALSHFASLTEDQRKMALIGAGFPYLRHQQKVSTLSGGERSRLLFVALTLANYSLLLLDEPTNHLDMEGKEELAATLQQFAGAVLLVTHDRTLMEQSCNRYWLIGDRQLSEWHDLSSIYTTLSGGGNAELVVSPERAPLAEAAISTNEDRLLATLVALEHKLEEDLTRKPKHQKPQLQQQWRREIAEINGKLGLI
jgi:ATPase subunit of ABC transporter with duplicated ATPase domains